MTLSEEIEKILEEFDKEFNFLFKNDKAIVFTSRISIKEFIAKSLLRVEQEARKEMVEGLKKKIKDIDNMKFPDEMQMSRTELIAGTRTWELAKKELISLIDEGEK